MFLPDDRHSCDTAIPENTDLKINNIPEGDICSYPLSTSVVKNTVYNQAQQKMSQILPCTKVMIRLSRIQFFMLLMLKELLA